MSGDIMKMRELILLAWVTLLLHACALSPQVVVIDPELSTEASNVALKPVSLKVDVEDPRSSPIIGQRGGIYKETSHISTDQAMTATLQKKLSAKFSALGYTVISKESPDAYLTINTSSIKYTVIEEKLLNQIQIDIELEAVVQKGNREFRRNYTVSRKKDVVKTPDMEDNEILVNESLAIVLQNLLSDELLFDFIDN